MVQSVTLSAIGVSLPQHLPNHNDNLGGIPVTTPSNPFNGQLPSVIAFVSSGATITYNIEFSQDGTSFVSDPASTGLTASINYVLAGFVNFWRINVTAYTSGSVTASAGLP